MKRRGVLCGALLLVCGMAAGCRKHPAASDLYNDNAQLKGALPYPVLQWPALTTSVDRASQTTATLFGNNAAAAAARNGEASYPAGAVLGLVTWQQREDPHWFGGRIPDAPRSVEFVEFGAGAMPVYKHFAGSPLTEQADSGDPMRIAAIESMKAVRLP